MSNLGILEIVSIESQPGPSKLGSRSWHVHLVWILCTCLALGMVAALGGFKDKPSERILVDPGTVVSLSCVEIRINRATAVAQNSEHSSWKITVFADIRNISGQPLIQSTVSPSIYLGYTNGVGEFVSTTGDMYLVLHEDDERPSKRTVIPPFGGPIPFKISIYVSEGFTESEPLMVGLFPMKYDNRAILGLYDENSWNTDGSANHFWVIEPPVAITPYLTP